MSNSFNQSLFPSGRRTSSSGSETCRVDASLTRVNTVGTVSVLKAGKERSEKAMNFTYPTPCAQFPVVLRRAPALLGGTLRLARRACYALLLFCPFPVFPRVKCRRLPLYALIRLSESLFFDYQHYSATDEVRTKQDRYYLECKLFNGRDEYSNKKTIRGSH